MLLLHPIPVLAFLTSAVALIGEILHATTTTSAVNPSSSEKP